MERKKLFLYLQSALCILTVLILSVSVIGVFREGAAWKAEGHPGDWIFTPEKAQEIGIRVLPAVLCGFVLTVTGLIRGIRSENADLPAADTETARDLICGRVKEPSEEMKKERDLQKKLFFGRWAGALLCMIPVLLYITDGRNFKSTDLETVMGALVLHILPWTAAALAILAAGALLGEKSMKREIAAAGALAAGPVSGTETGSRVSAGSRQAAYIRGMVLAAAVLCIIAGIYNGSMRDVLFKAINICTECIGLG